MRGVLVWKKNSATISCYKIERYLVEILFFMFFGKNPETIDRLNIAPFTRISENLFIDNEWSLEEFLDQESAKFSTHTLCESFK